MAESPPFCWTHDARIKAMVEWCCRGRSAVSIAAEMGCCPHQLRALALRERWPRAGRVIRDRKPGFGEWRAGGYVLDELPTNGCIHVLREVGDEPLYCGRNAGPNPRCREHAL